MHILVPHRKLLRGKTQTQANNKEGDGQSLIRPEQPVAELFSEDDRLGMLESGMEAGAGDTGTRGPLPVPND